MRTAFHIFRRDVLRILHNPIAVIVLAALCVLPNLYAWMNIYSNWDPYSNTAGIKVAVVNEDVPAIIEGMGSVCVGDSVTEALRDNDKIGWQFYDSRDAAVEDVSAGKCYAAIVMPRDFSTTLTSALRGNAQQAKLDYFVNEKVSAISPKVTDSGAGAVEKSINENFLETAGTVVAERLGTLAGGTSADMSLSSARVADAVDGAVADIDTLMDALERASSAANEAATTVRSSSENLDNLAVRTSNATDRLTAALDTVGESHAAATDLLTQLNASLAQGASTLSGVSASAGYDIAKIATEAGSASSKVSGAAASLRGMHGIGSRARDAVNEAREALDDIRSKTSNERILELIDELSGKLDAVIAAVDAQEAKIDGAIETVENAGAKAAADAEAISGAAGGLNDAVKSGTDALTSTSDVIANETTAKVNGAYNSLATASAKLSGAMSAARPLLEQTQATLGQLADVCNQTGDTVNGTLANARSTRDALSDLSRDIRVAGLTASGKIVDAIADLDPTNVGDLVKEPVHLHEVDLFPVATYGAGVAPFFTSVGLWMGGFFLIAIIKFEVDRDGVEPFLPWQGYVGRLMLMVSLSLIQALVCATGDLLIGVPAANIPALYLACIVGSLVFMNIIYALSSAFKHIGKALALVLIILQVPGSSGTYPIEMMPGFFRTIEPWLPFTYSNDAIREALAGFYDGRYWSCLGSLLLFLIPALLIGLGARRHLININTLFDQRLRESHLMVSEPYDAGHRHIRLSSIVKVLHSSKEYGDILKRRTAAFELAYPILVRRGFICLFAVPAAILVLMLVLDAGMWMMGLWFVVMVLIAAFLVFIEYFHAQVAANEELADKSREELYEMIDDEMRDEFAAFAPIDAILAAKRANATNDTDTEESEADKTGVLDMRGGDRR